MALVSPYKYQDQITPVFPVYGCPQSTIIDQVPLIEKKIPLMRDMIEWGVKYDSQPDVPDNIINGAPAKLLTRLHKDREALINEILNELENA